MYAQAAHAVAGARAFGADMLPADSELLGIRHHIVIGDRSLKEGKVEYARRTDSQAQSVAVEEAAAKVPAAL